MFEQLNDDCFDLFYKRKYSALGKNNNVNDEKDKSIILLPWG